MAAGVAQGDIERWRQYERQRQEEAKEKTRERIKQLRAAKGQESFYA
jgi:N-methylhydantoinase B/oxoprolinase/acetone carboxylase alpha subunit